MRSVWSVPRDSVLSSPTVHPTSSSKRQFIERQFIKTTVYRTDLSDLTATRHYYGVVTMLECTAAAITLYLSSKCNVSICLSLVSTGG